MIRKHQESDLDSIMYVWQVSSAIAHPFLNSLFVKKVEYDMKTLYIPNSDTWIYENDQEAVGFISMNEDEIGGLFVLPQHFSKGIGTELVNHVSASHKKLEVEVFEKNEIGRAFYKKYGFNLVKEFLHEESGERVLRLKK